VEVVDFISEATLKTDLKPPSDCLGHDRVARSILDKVALLQPGSMIALQGPWGRGKTDVLWRVAILSGAGKPEVPVTQKAIWINPWQYGTPDLLSPLVLALLKLVPEERRTRNEALWKAAESIIKAGVGFGIKATSFVVPGGKIFEAVASEAKDLLSGLFEAQNLDRDHKPDPDPVSEMGRRFDQLVKEVFANNGTDNESRLLICVDDLDRCLPHRQVALLEALHFLISAGAPATILVALDPTLARQSVIAHYGTRMFDPERYLDKMFDLRITLPALSGEVLAGLVKKQLASLVDFKGTRVSYMEVAADHCGKLFPDLQGAFKEALFLPDFCNPRMIKRMLERIRLLASSNVSLEMDIDRGDAWLLVLWLALVERRPELRSALQGADGADTRGQRLSQIRSAYIFDTSKRESVEVSYGVGTTHRGETRRTVEPPPSEIQAKKDSAMEAIGMPRRDDAADLVTVLHKLYDLERPSWREAGHWATLAQIFSRFDDILVRAGL